MPVFTVDNPQAHFCPYCMNKVRPGEVCRNCSLKQGSYTPSPHHIPPGTVLMDRYLVGRVLGEGGFGITYIGCDLRLESKVAIKEYFPVEQVSRYAEGSLDVITRAGRSQESYEHGIQRFLREARTLARMEKQSAVVTAKDFFEANNTAYIVMEYIQGTDLKTLVAQRGGKIPAQELLATIEPLFAALDAVHQAGLIHRDISPDNIMLEKGQVRLLDFGCARESIKGTETMTVALKQGYAPVEQYQRKGQGPWTDVYALAAVIYFCLTGRVPPASLDRILEDELVPPRQLGADITAEQEAALMKAMSLSSKQRYQSVATFYEALYHYHHDEDDDDDEDEGDKDDKHNKRKKKDNPPPPPPEPKKIDWKKYAPWIGGAAIVLVLGICLVAALAGGPDPNPDPTDPIASTAATNGSEGVVTSTSYVYDADQFLSDLEDPAVGKIIVAGSFTIPAGGTVEIAKPVTIGSAGGICSLSAVVVSGGGEVTIQGELTVEQGLLCTTGGGTIDLESSGTLNVWKLWLEQEEDFTRALGATLDVYGSSAPTAGSQCYIVLSEDALFGENATRVSTWSGLYSAAAQSDTQAIIIESGSQITFNYWLDVSVPILVEEGASVDIGSQRWNVYGAALVNRGTISGDLYLYEDGYTFLNYGTFTSGTFSLEGIGNFINLGDTTLYTLAAKFCDFVNLGNATFIGGSESWFFDFRDNVIMNFGTWTLEQGSGTTDAAYITTDYRLVNHGTLEIGRNAELCIYGLLENRGTLALTDGSAQLHIEGYLSTDTDGAQFTAVEGASLGGGGVLIYQDADAIPEAALDSGVQLICTDTSGSATYVSSAWDLENALNDDSIDLVVVQNITMPTDLTIDKNLIIEVGFTVSGNVTVTSGAWVYDRYGALSVDGKLTVSDDSAVVCRDGLKTSGGISLDSGGRFYGPCEKIDASLTIGSGSRCVLMETYSMEHVEISIENGGALQIFGNLTLADCHVYVAFGGELRSDFADVWLASLSSLDNYGNVIFNCNHWVNTLTLQGDVTNYSSGIMELQSDGHVLVSGTFINGGKLLARWSDEGGLTITGTLNNAGTMSVLSDSANPALTQDGGELTGNDPIIYSD